jgi:tRNA-dihydrouridine synthase 1
MGSQAGVEEMQGVVDVPANGMNGTGAVPRKRVKLHGRTFYESIGSPKLILAPMVEQSEFVRFLFLSPFYIPTLYIH